MTSSPTSPPIPPPEINEHTLALLKIPANAGLVGDFLLLLSRYHPDCILSPSSPTHPWLIIQQKPTDPPSC